MTTPESVGWSLFCKVSFSQIMRDTRPGFAGVRDVFGYAVNTRPPVTGIGPNGLSESVRLPCGVLAKQAATILSYEHTPKTLPHLRT